MNKRQKEKLNSKLQKEIQAILDQYPDGLRCDKTELLLDVRHDLELMVKRLNISPKTPIDVWLDGGAIVVRFGCFPNQN